MSSTATQAKPKTRDVLVIELAGLCSKAKRCPSHWPEYAGWHHQINGVLDLLDVTPA